MDRIAQAADRIEAALERIARAAGRGQPAGPDALSARPLLRREVEQALREIDSLIEGMEQ